MAEAMGFFTDTTVCIGCKACEVACKEWNQLPAENGGIRELSGDSYDNTRRLDGIHWRHVRFIEQFKGPYDGRWLMMSDVCKHCVKAALYGADSDGPLGGLNSFYLLVDEPEVYGLPRKPQLPTRNLAKSAGFSVLSAGVLGVLALVGLRKRRMDQVGGSGGSN